MNKCKKSSSGITLISLVITIIILIILAGITIAQLTGNGLFSKTQSAVTSQKLAMEREALELVNIELFLNKKVDKGNITAEIIKKEIKNKLDEDLSVVETSEGVFIITFKDTGNVFKLDTEDSKVTFLGTHSSDYEDVQLTEQDIKFTLSPEGWTNGNVVTTIKVNENISMVDRKLQWTRTPLEESSWQDYTSATQIISTQNEEIYARVYEKITGKYTIAEVNIQSIDKVKPVIEEVTTTTNSVTFKAKDEASGMIGYAITETNEEPTSFESCTNTKNLEVTSKDKKQGTDYYVWVKDEAGNLICSNSNKTGNVGDLTQANTTFEYNPNDWTNGSVKVTASTSEDTTNYTLRITKADLTSLSSQEILKLPLGSQGIEIDTNNTTVYAILVDDVGQIGSAATATVDNIDKNAPTIESLEQGETTTSSIQVSVSATDTQSGIDKYRYSSDGGTTWSEYTTSSSYKLENLTKGFGCSYSITVEVTDKVGNVTTSNQAMSTTNNDAYIANDAGTELIKYNWDQSGTGAYRKMTKSYDGKAIVGIAYVNDCIAPILVSTDSNAVSYCTSDSGNNVFTSGGSFNWGGTKYYYSSTGYWFYKNCKFTSKFRNINRNNESFSSMESVASELLNKYYTGNNSEFEINYNSNSGNAIDTRTYFTPGSNVTITNDVPTKDGYHLLGWSKNYNSTSAEYRPGETYLFDQSTTLYAIWQKHDFSDETGICTVCKTDCNYLTASNGGENWNSGQILNYATGFSKSYDCCRNNFNGSWNIHSSCNLCSWAFNNNGGIGSASDYSDTDGNVCMIIYKNLIDVTNIDKIVFKCQLDENASFVTNKTKIGLCNSNSLSEASDYYNFQQSTEVTDNTMSTATYVLQLDVSSYTGNYYLKVTTERLGGTAAGNTAATKIISMYPVYK